MRCLSRHRHDDSSEIISFLAVKVTFFVCISNLLFEIRDCVRGLSLLFFASLSEPRGSPRVFSSFEISHFGRSLHVYRDLDETVFGVHG